jgi:TonB family protein
MDEWLEYLIKVVISQALMCLFYHLLLLKSTNFRLNRYYLLVTMVTPLVIPMVNLGSMLPAATGTGSIFLREVTVGIELPGVYAGHHFAFSAILFWLYLSGVFFMMLRNMRQAIVLIRIHNHSVAAEVAGFRTRITSERVTACSFMQHIYLDRDTATIRNIEMILRHENTHICQWHALDVLASELLCTFIWFSPLTWLLRNSIREVHEYLADDAVRRAGSDTLTYSTLLSTYSAGLHPAVSNPFNQSLTLKRIKMMTQTRSGRFATLRVLPVIPLLLLLVIAFAGRQPAGALVATGEEVLFDKLGNLTEAPDGWNFSTTDIQPQYPGGNEAMIKFMTENLRYPESARKEGQEGVVYVQFTVTADGKISDVNLKKGVEATLDAEAKRVVSMMPDWIPGQHDGKAVDMEMVLPVNFKLGDKK